MITKPSDMSDDEIVKELQEHAKNDSPPPDDQMARFIKLHTEYTGRGLSTHTDIQFSFPLPW